VPGFSAAEVAGPGFINLRLDTAARAYTIVDAGTAHRGTVLAGTSINVEFISATDRPHPPGPRYAVATIARVRRSRGADVTREFINDRGVQMDKFGVGDGRRQRAAGAR
jgi:arginyl-tRNA synthetase